MGTGCRAGVRKDYGTSLFGKAPAPGTFALPGGGIRNIGYFPKIGDPNVDPKIL